MTTEEETLPFDIRMVTPGTPEYEAGLEIDGLAQRNLKFLLEHEQEINERFPGPCTLLVFGGGEVRGCSSFEEVMEILDSLDELERSAALQFEQPEHGAVWIL